MRLGELVQGFDALKTSADLAVEVTSLAYDSRRVQQGTLFFAIPGEKADGHEFIVPALKAGAVAVVSERAAPEELATRWVRVTRTRRALATVARTFYGDPNSRLKLIGVTGTNGKTTTSYLLQSILQAAGISSGLLTWGFALRSDRPGSGRSGSTRGTFLSSRPARDRPAGAA